MRSSLLRRALAVLAFSSAPLAAGSLPLAGCSSDSNPMNQPDAGGSVFGPLGQRTDLPVDETIDVAGLSAPVDVVRDKFGRPHIYAANIKDAMRVEGFMVAKDRTLQVEFLRRVAEGRLAEILADSQASTIDLDISYRHIGLGRTAKAQYDALPAGDERDLLDAFSDGVSQVFRKIRSNEIHLPVGVFAIPVEAFTDWTGVDSLAIARLQTHLLSYDADFDIETQIFFDAAHSTFTAADPDPLLAKRAGLERDLFRFAPGDPATTTTGYPMGKPGAHKAPKGTKRPAGAGWAGLKETTSRYLAAMKLSRKLMNPEGFGSNNWAISASRSKSGHALVASDPHLPLGAPAIFWPVSIDVTAPKGGDASQNLRVAGVSFPGIPGIILGHNEHIAWGATVAGYDVSDAYAETLTADGSGVMFQGKAVPFETVDEVINIQSKPAYTYHVKVVPHHGPLQPNITAQHTVEDPDPKKGAISIRWTGLEATTELKAIVGLLRAKNVDEARTTLKDFGVGAQNWMLGDTSGDILWTSHAKVPVRDPKSFAWNAQTYDGTLPCMVLPGDGSAEWKGYLNDDLVPWVKNPSAGFISTANNDPIGVSLDNDPSNDKLPDNTPMYLACQFDIGYREGRIHKRIADHTDPFDTDALSAIQGDHRSPMGAALVPALLDAIDRAEEERKSPGMHPDLATVVKDPDYKSASVIAARALLDAWGKEADYDAASGIDPDTNKPKAASGADAAEVKASQATLIFNTWLMRFFGRTFGDELGKMGVGFESEMGAKALVRLVSGDPMTFATYDATTLDSSLWDDLGTPMVVESRQDRMVRALVDALTTLEKTAGPDIGAYRWGSQHTITFTALISLFGNLSIPPSGDSTFPSGFPRPGDSFNIDAADYGFASNSDVPDFTYAHGPSQRFVIEMDPAGPKAYNALPGGNVWDAKSPHFRDEAELWRRNKTHMVPFLLADVIAAKETRTVAKTP
jgi:penicillin G amidase